MEDIALDQHEDQGDLPEEQHLDGHGAGAAEGDEQDELSLALPIQFGDEVIGTLDLSRDPDNPWSEEEIATAQAIIEQVGLSLEKQRLFDLAQQRAREAQQRSQELALVNRVVTTVAASMDLKQSLEVVASELTETLSVDETAVALFNEEGTELIVVANAAKAGDASSAVGWVIPVQDEPAARQLVTAKKPLMIRDAKTNPTARPLQDLVHARNYETMVLCPLVAGQEVIGTVLMANLREGASLSDEEMRLAETIVVQAATAIQNAQLFEKTEAALNETANLYQASAELNAAQSMEDVLAVLRRHTIIGQSAQHVSVNLFNQPGTPDLFPERMSPVAQWSQLMHTKVDDSSIHIRNWTKAKELLRPDEIVIIHDLANDPRVDYAARALFMGRLDAKTLLIAPFIAAGQWIGNLIATYKEKVDFPESELRRLETLAGQAAGAVQNIRLLEETTRKANQLETAAEIARDSSSTLDMDVLMTRAINLVRDRFNFYHASIFMVEDDQAVVKASTGEAGHELERREFNLPLEEGASVIGQVAHTGEPVVINDVLLSDLFHAYPSLPETKSQLGIPLKVGQRVIGALDVHSSEVNAFSDEDVSVLRTLADQLAVALDNARSFALAQKAVEEMRELDRLKSQFLANMSHELRTPLNSIIGFSRVILKGIDGPVTDLQKQDLEAIYNSGQHLLDMINSILDLSKIEAGRMELSIEEMDPLDVINSVTATAAGLVKEKPIELIERIPDTLPPIRADRTRLRQVLLNLLQNAAKFTEEGSIEVGAEVQTGPLDRPELVVWVKDTGIGIEPEHQEKLFEPFSQVDDSPTRKTGGSGLGLSISRRLVEMQGGRIWFESEVGVGSTFYFSLPLAGAAGAKTGEEDGSETSFDQILAVDDDENVIGLYARYLRPLGFEVVPLTDPKRALEEVKRLKPHAVTLDIMMPGRDGWQVLHQIKTDPETEHIPVIVCSIIDDKQRGLKLGAAEYLVKPILEDELVKAIERLPVRSNPG